MPNTTDYRFGDLVLVPFPFTDQTGIKKRPAIVVSSDAYQRARPDVVLMAVTSQIKPVVTTIEKRLILRRLGELQEVDRTALRQALRMILG